jgi:hypothetical protein
MQRIRWDDSHQRPLPAHGLIERPTLSKGLRARSLQVEAIMLAKPLL